MTLVSYAQNYEDIMLLRALGDVERGFYVDVGAQDPVEDSVTKLFYELGWRGVNIEPVRHWYERLLQDRPEDINLRLLVTDQPGTATFYEVTDTGLSTMDGALATAHADAGRQVVGQTLECVTLDSVLSRNTPPVIHFLKVDVEGAEARVLRGLSLGKYRPWVLVIEACAPNSTIQTHDEWESGVVDAGYRFVYYDGLNRFYLAEEQASRAAAFAAPPNVLDGFIRYGEWRVRNQLALLQVASEDKSKQIEVLGATVGQRDVQIQQWRTRAADLSAQAERLQQLSDARSAEAESLRLHIAEWSARAAELSEHIERVQQLADASQAQLVEAGRAAAREIAARDASLLEARVELMATRAACSFAEMELQRREALIAQVLSSRSWRLTRPLRVFARLLRHGPAELASAVSALFSAGRSGRMAQDVWRRMPGLRRDCRPSQARTAEATDEHSKAAASSATDMLSDKAETALAAMDQVRDWPASDPGRH